MKWGGGVEGGWREGDQEEGWKGDLCLVCKINKKVQQQKKSGVDANFKANEWKKQDFKEQLA